MNKREELASQTGQELHKSEELISRLQFDDTPIMIIHSKEQNISFATIGKYKITPDFKTSSEVTAYLSLKPWKVIFDIIGILIEANK